MSDIVLYDLANRQDASWSPAPWKTRLALNFKGVPYTTEWVEYPDLAPKLKAAGIPPNDPNAPGYFADYSSPTVRFADGAYVMGSLSIASKLEGTYPEPSLHLDTGLHEKVDTIASEVTMAVLPNALPNVVNNVLQEPSKTWFAEDRHRRFGMSLDELASKLGGEQGWQNAQESLKKLKDLLAGSKKNEGPFLLGSTPSYGDFLIAALFESLERLKKDDYEKVMGYDETFTALHEACKPWTKKDG